MYKIRLFCTPVSDIFNFHMFIYIQKQCHFMIKPAAMNWPKVPVTKRGGSCTSEVCPAVFL
jgi:hypothetical protein